MPLDQCPCPKGEGAWLAYRGLLKEERDKVKLVETKYHELFASSTKLIEGTRQLLDRMPDNAEQQMIALAMAELGLRRPGWHWALGILAEKMKIKSMYDGFYETHKDRIKPEFDDVF